MFRTSQVVYLVAVFFLMRHYKLFNLVEKNVKLKDKSYLLGFKFAALFVGARLVEKAVHYVFDNVRVLPRLPKALDDRMFVLEGHSNLCTYVKSTDSVPDLPLVAIQDNDPSLPVTETTGCTVGDIQFTNPDGTSGTRTGYTDCVCQPNNTGEAGALPLFNSGAADPTDAQCSSNELAGGICPEDVVPLASRPGGCCPPNAVDNYYLAFNTLAGAHVTVAATAVDAQGHTPVNPDTPGLPAGWPTYLANADGEGAPAFAVPVNREYTRPGGGTVELTEAEQEAAAAAAALATGGTCTGTADDTVNFPECSGVAAFIADPSATTCPPGCVFTPP